METELGDFIEAAGLLEYDPAAITRIYAGHPQRLLRRLWQTLLPIGLFLIGLAGDKVFGLLNDPNRARSRARELAELLVELGPAFIKAGQALSSRPDLVPPILLEELSQLQSGYIDLRNHADYYLKAILKEMQVRLEQNLVK